MGTKRMGPPEGLVIKLKDVVGSECFIETGTFKGNTAKWASNYFDKVITIENSSEIYKDTSNRLSEINNIDFRFGHTIEKLQEIVPALGAPAIFWLDAHWCGGASYGRQDECPIITEVEIINRSKQSHCILIDDARLFMAPPPYPHDMNMWPDITALLNAINEKKNRYTVIHDDAIISVPEIGKEIVQEYCRAIDLPASPMQTIKTGMDTISSGIQALFSRR